MVKDEHFITRWNIYVPSGIIKPYRRKFDRPRRPWIGGGIVGGFLFILSKEADCDT